MNRVVDSFWLITGCNQGLGLGLAQCHLDRGGHVIATYRGICSQELKELAAAHRDRLRLVCFDQEAPPGMDTLKPGSEFPIEVMIHNAGVYGPRTSSVFGLDHDETLRAININALGVLRVTEAFLPAMQGAQNPRIAAVSSLLGTHKRGGANDMAYRLSKAALNMVMHGLAAELAPQCVATTCLRPGPVRTRMNPKGKITTKESASALLKVIDNMKYTSPKPEFLDFNGEPLDW